MDSRLFAGVAALCGAYVVWSELNFRGTSTLTPILLLLGVGIVALAVAHFVRHRSP